MSKNFKPAPAIIKSTGSAAPDTAPDTEAEDQAEEFAYTALGAHMNHQGKWVISRIGYNLDGSARLLELIQCASGYIDAAKYQFRIEAANRLRIL